LERDLQFRSRLRAPDQARREHSAFERLLNELGLGSISDCGEAAYEVLKRLADTTDRANEYSAVVAEHDALHGYLALLDAAYLRKTSPKTFHKQRARLHAHNRLFLGPTALGTQQPCVAGDRETLDLQRGVLDVILREYPQELTLREVAEFLFSDLDEPNAGGPLACAVRDLSIGGLLKPRGPLVLPTRAALHLKRLQSCN
jgi:hypothetical protein